MRLFSFFHSLLDFAIVSFSHTYSTWERVLRLLSKGQVNLTPVIGGLYDLNQWEAAFGAMEEGTNVKSVIVMDRQR